MSQRKPVGEGCIEGMRCPECDNYNVFKIVATTLVRAYEDGTEETGDTEWGDDSFCMCPDCGRDGTVRDFKPALRRKRAPKADPWNDNTLQFPRLLAEIRAVGLTKEQLAGLSASMDLSPRKISSLLARAEEAFELIKGGL